jgi:pyrroline-5-carboxylate reductase
MDKNLSLTIIGPGVMAEALLKNLLSKKLIPSKQIIVSGPQKERVQELKQLYGVLPETNNVKAVQNADVILLCVKPQTLNKVLDGIRGQIKPDALLITIVAGASIKKISKAIQHNLIVRAMPNTPAQIGEGITVWTASLSVTEEQKEIARMIFTAMGNEIFVEEENYLDKATALSGTGPAYVYLFMEAMVDAGVHLGFPRRIAEKLVIETLRGSVDFYDHGDEINRHLAALRNQVTSPGGTSAEALYYLEKAGFRTALSRAIWAAYQRTLELGQDSVENKEDEKI